MSIPSAKAANIYARSSYNSKAARAHKNSAARQAHHAKSHANASMRPAAPRRGAARRTAARSAKKGSYPAPPAMPQAAHTKNAATSLI